MRELLLLSTAAMILLASCAEEPKPVKAPEPVAPTPETVVTGDPLNNTGLQFNGTYQESLGNVIYFMRFFPEGNVVMVNGPSKDKENLRRMLVKDALTNGDIGFHNVPVRFRNDSLVFSTFPRKGEISYNGVVASPDTVRLLKYSHINGRKLLVDLVFEADTIGS